jgi:hypothetical protein
MFLADSRMDDFLKLNRRAFRSIHGLSIDPDTQRAIEPSDADGWLRAARRHRVAGLWADGLNLPELVPSVAPAWKTIAYGQALHTARLTAEAGRIFPALQCAVPDLRLVKGPALAAQAWPQPGLRTFDDLDFRCGKQHLGSLLKELSALGYRPEVSEANRLNHLWRFGWGITFRHADGFMVEFNHRMFPPHFPWPERLSRYVPELWKMQTLDGVPVPCPAPALHLLLACVHAVWHAWERLDWMVDIAGLLVRHPGIFAEAQHLVSRGSLAQKALSCCCCAADRLFGPLPGVPQHEAPDEELAEQAIASLMRTDPDVPATVRRQLHYRLMRPQESILYTIRRLATPGDPDFKQWSLTGTLRPLYWVLRPLRYIHDRKKKGSN